MAQARAAVASDLAVIYRLLEQEGLPMSDLVAAKPQFVVLSDGGAIVAAGALERFGTAALLRSVVVAGERRGEGLGRDVVRELETTARGAGISQLILLTQTAAEFFTAQGYRTIERGEAPPAVQGSQEFRSLCPSSAVCMMKTLDQ
jgi:amino-acid N-acetyltransferase